MEVTTQKSCTLIAKDEVVAGTRSAAYRQGRIDAEIDAAKEVVDRLAAQKDIILQKRFDFLLIAVYTHTHTNTKKNTHAHTQTHTLRNINKHTHTRTQIIRFFMRCHLFPNVHRHQKNVSTCFMLYLS